jgi:hypothetical protein
MARLKVKQISDFDSKVQALIDGDNDQNATIIGAISTEADAVSSALAAEILATNGDVTTLTALAGSISSDLAAEILATNGDVNTLTALAGSISGDVDTVEANLAAEILATNGDVNTLTALAGTISTELVDEIDSVDTRFGTIATGSSLAALETRVSNDEDALAAEIGATNADVSTLTALAGSISGDVDVVEAALAAEILATNGEITALQNKDGSADTRFGSADTRLTSADARMGQNATAASNAQASIDAILVGANANTDTFAETISYINSVDDASDLDLVNELVSVDNRFGSGDSRFGGLDTLVSQVSTSEAAVSAALATEILATNGDVNTLTALAGTISTELVDEIDSVDTRFGTIATSTSLGSLESRVSLDEDALAAEIGATNSDVSTLTTLAGSISSDLAAEILATNGDVNTLTALAGSISSDVDVVEAGIVTLDTYIDGVSADLAAEISTTDGEISTLQGKVTQLEGDSTYIHDYAAMAGVDQFRCTVQVEHASDDDMQVFINGHAIGRLRTVSVDGVDTKYGWEHNSNNTTFDLHNIGYDLDGTDVIYVVSHS